MKVLRWMLITILLLSALTGYAASEAVLTYRETTEQNVEEIQYVLTLKESRIHIKADFKDEYHSIVTDKNLDTTKLEISFQKNAATITIYREADRLVIDRKQNRTIQVNSEIPWYQTLISLKEFALSRDRERSFYVLSSHFDERLSEGKGIQLLRLVAGKEA